MTTTNTKEIKMKKSQNTAQQPQSDHPSSEPNQEVIAISAYLIWEQEGRPDGAHEAHWLQAESQLRQCAYDRAA